MEEERQRLDGEGDSIRELTRRVWKGKYFFAVEVRGNLTGRHSKCVFL